MISRWQFSALDTWFFRESRPMESIGGSELQSGFPPSPRTASGAIRHLVGQKHAVDWSKWNTASEYTDLKQTIGDAKGFGKLKFSGPWLSRITDTGEVERLYPAPANLVAVSGTLGVQDPIRLVVGEPRHCDLGESVRMAVVDQTNAKLADAHGDKFKSVGGYWLTAETLTSILAGNSCKANELIDSNSLIENESRLGIARSNVTRTVEAGMLYQTRHVRPAQNVVLQVDVEGLVDTDYEDSGVVKLGGEGRGAAYRVKQAGENDTLSSGSGLPAANVPEDARGIILMLLTPLSIKKCDGGYQPLPGFNQVEEAGRTVWKGSINDIALSVYCSVQGKMIREGGWDLANHCPREVQSLVPAGSVFYIEVDNGDIQCAVNAIHLTQLAESPEDIALGRGLVAVGVWPNNEWVEKESK